jgi:hypothetical protein
MNTDTVETGLSTTTEPELYPVMAGIFAAYTKQHGVKPNAAKITEIHGVLSKLVSDDKLGSLDFYIAEFTA